MGLYLNLVHTLGLTISDLDSITYSTFLDMIIEKNNDNCEYAILATQEDFDRF